MTNFIKRETIQSVQDLQWEDVPVDEWEKGAVVRMVGVNAKEASRFSKKLVQLDPKGNVRSVRLDGFMEELVILTACNENFEPLFTVDDKEWLGKKSAKVLKRLADAAQRLSGMNEDAVAGAVKNSDGIPGDAVRID